MRKIPDNVLDDYTKTLVGDGRRDTGHSALGRLAWLVRRLSRSDPAEFPYRLAALSSDVARWARLQDGARVSKPVLQGFGAPWVAAPGTKPAPSLIAVADAFAGGRLDVFGARIAFEAGHPRWNLDPRTGIEIPKHFGSFLDFRDLGHDIDIKFLWELNRHLWWVPVAQAYAATGEPRYLDAIGRWLGSWLRDCPYPLGANWSSPLEHGIRLINWSVIWHLIGGQRSALFAGAAGSSLLDRWLDAVFLHMRFVRTHYSRYTSAGNHRIGEAAGVYVGALTWPVWTECEPWAREAKNIIETETQKQFSPEGVNREQAFCYHRFALEFLLAAISCGSSNGDAFSSAFADRVEAAVGFLAACIDAGGNVPRYGDGDDGQAFSLSWGNGISPAQAIVAIGARLFHRPELTTTEAMDVACAWLAPALAHRPEGASHGAGSRPLPGAYGAGGFAILGRHLGDADEIRVLFDVGPLGYNRTAAHGHADVLAVTVSACGRELLVDSGTYCYNSAPDLRRHLRSTAAHNTLLVDGENQSPYGGSFLWLRDVATCIERATSMGGVDTIIASHDGYARLRDPVRHRREVEFRVSEAVLTITDSIEAKEPHPVAVRWHLAPECEVVRDGDVIAISSDGVRLNITMAGGSPKIVVASATSPDAWISRRFYHREPSHLIELRTMLDPASRIVTTMEFTVPPFPGRASVRDGAPAVEVMGA